jgi:hypothetical protein
MALIQAEAKGKKVSLNIELDRKTNTTLKKYARFSGADTDKVVAGALQRLFEQDEEFVPWLREKDEMARRRAERRAKKSLAAVGESSL